MEYKEIGLKLEDTKAYIIYHMFKDIKIKTFLVSFADKRRILSTLEGFMKVKFVGNHYIPEKLWGFIHRHKKEYEKKIYTDLKIYPNKIAMLYTGVDMDNISIKIGEYDNIKIYACVTAGVKSNAQRIGVDKAENIEKEGGFKRLSTINAIILTNMFLTDGAIARSIITITEAKTQSLQDLDIRSSYNSKIQATGTGTDNIIVVSGCGPKITCVGGHVKAGEIMAKEVTCAVKNGIFKQDKISDKK